MEEMVEGRERDVETNGRAISRRSGISRDYHVARAGVEGTGDKTIVVHQQSVGSRAVHSMYSCLHSAYSRSGCLSELHNQVDRTSYAQTESASSRLARHPGPELAESFSPACVPAPDTTLSSDTT